jgi:hypothetical protein
VSSDPVQEQRVLSLVDAHPGLSLAGAQEACPDLSVDGVWTLLATRGYPFSPGHFVASITCHEGLMALPRPG